MDISNNVHFRLNNDPTEGKFPKKVLGNTGEGRTFSDMIQKAIGDVDMAEKTSERGVADIISGKSENVHEVMIGMQKAQLSFQLMLEIRNKAIETYQELSRMQM
jgi:flagellar hook-basal body complex protein FliE